MDLIRTLRRDRVPTRTLTEECVRLLTEREGIPPEGGERRYDGWAAERYPFAFAAMAFMFSSIS